MWLRSVCSLMCSRSAMTLLPAAASLPISATICRSRGQAGDLALFGVLRFGRLVARQLQEDAAGGAAVEPDFAFGDFLDGLQDGFRRLALFDHTHGAGQHRGIVHRRVARSGKHQHPGLRLGNQVGNGVDAAFTTEVDVQQHDIGLGFVQQAHGFGRRGCLADYHHARGFALDQLFEAPQHAAVVIDQQDLDLVFYGGAGHRQLVPVKAGWLYVPWYTPSGRAPLRRTLPGTGFGRQSSGA